MLSLNIVDAKLNLSEQEYDIVSYQETSKLDVNTISSNNFKSVTLHNIYSILIGVQILYKRALDV